MNNVIKKTRNRPAMSMRLQWCSLKVSLVSLHQAGILAIASEAGIGSFLLGLTASCITNREDLPLDLALGMVQSHHG
jgi:hypothetical protein